MRIYLYYFLVKTVPVLAAAGYGAQPVRTPQRLVLPPMPHNVKKEDVYESGNQ